MNLETLFTGANPNLFYGSLGCIVGAIVLFYAIRLTIMSLIEKETEAYRSQARRHIRGLLGTYIPPEFYERQAKSEARRQALDNLDSPIWLANAAGIGCWLLGLAGVVGVLLYIVQRYDVV